MSKLLDKLRRLSHPAPSLGFHIAPVPKGPSMLLILRSPSPQSPVGEGVDAFLVEGGGSGKDLIPRPKLLGEVPWGVYLEEIEPKKLDYLKEKGCDFVVLNSLAPASLLSQEGMARLLAIEPSLPEGLVRAINGLSLDAVLVNLEGGELTIQHLLLCQSLASQIRKPVLASLPQGGPPEGLSQLGRSGIKGLVVKVAEPSQLQLWQQALASMTLPKEPQTVQLPQPPAPSEEE